jgi:hypothetical protein
MVRTAVVRREWGDGSGNHAYGVTLAAGLPPSSGAKSVRKTNSGSIQAPP